MKCTNLRAVYKGDLKNASRKKKIIEMVYESSNTTGLQTGFIYDMHLNCGHTSQIIVVVKLAEDLQLKYESMHEYLADWADINSI